jgi:hypothetical protein
VRRGLKRSRAFESEVVRIEFSARLTFSEALCPLCVHVVSCGCLPGRQEIVRLLAESYRTRCELQGVYSR